MVAPTTESSSKLKMKFSFDDFRLSDVWEVAQRRWTTLAVCVIALWALGLLYCYVASTTYESTGQVLVMKKDTTVATGSAPSNSSKSDISEDLLATHMMILSSKSNVNEALSRTIRKSKLDELIAEHQKKENRESNNLRIMIGRWTGVIQVEPAPETPAVPAATTPTATPTSESAPAAGSAAAVASATPATNATASPAAATSTTTPLTPDATATPLAPSTPAVATSPAPAAPIDNAATPTPTGTPDSTAPVTVTSTEPVPGEPIPFRSELDEAPQEPPGPTADGDEVIMLADLPGIKAELKTGQFPVNYVIENLTVTKGGDAAARDSHVLGLSFHHKNAVESKIVLEALLKAYQNFLADKFADVNREAAKLIEQASKNLKLELETAQFNYQRFREQSPIIFSGDQATNIHRQRLETFNAELAILSGKVIDSRSRLEAVELKLATREKTKMTDIEQLSLIDAEAVTRIGTIATIALGQASVMTESFQADQAERTASAALDYGEIVKREAEREAMLQEKGPNHPDVLALTRAIDLAKKKVAANKVRLSVTGTAEESIKVTPKMVMDGYLTLLRTDVGTLQSREQELTELAREEEERAKALVVYELEGERLREEAGRAQGLYEAVMDRLRELDLAKDYTGFVNEVIMAPENGIEVWPSLPLVLALCTLVGCAIGAGLAGVSEFRDRTFRDPDDIRRDLDMPLLTHVPDLRGKGAAQVIEGSQMHASMYTYHRPKSRESEVFRGLRTSLFFSNNAQKAQVIMFTSPNQGDGKSTVASNLAVSIAQTGRKVLMIDCDLRRPNVHRLLGIKNDVGLSDVIGGEVEPWDAIQQTENTNLWALPAGPLPSNPAELLQSTTFEQMLKLAREKYDYVILDCPPVLAVADPCIVAPRADGIALVLRVSRDSKPQANRAKEMLARVHGRMLGVVVNASQEAAKAGYGRYGDSAYAYSYDYGYGYGKGYGRGYNKYYEEDSSADRANGSGR